MRTLAFLATGIVVWVLRTVFADSAARARAGWTAPVLAMLIAVQLVLGVEAWMAKFGTYTLPELVPVTVENATTRTLHALVGSGVHLFLPIGEVLMTPSREELQYTEDTKRNLKKHLALAVLEVAQRVRESRLDAVGQRVVVGLNLPVPLPAGGHRRHHVFAGIRDGTRRRGDSIRWHRLVLRTQRHLLCGHDRGASRPRVTGASQPTREK